VTPEFIITTGRIEGARLSRPGHWGNLPFASIEDAEQEARRLGGAGVTIRHERCLVRREKRR